MKKFIALTLSLLMLCACTFAYAATVSSEEIAGILGSLSIVSGYPDGSLHLDDNVTRAQFTKIMVTASKYKNSVSTKSTTSPFKDVPYSDWAAPYISVAVSNGMISGYPDATFKPDQNVTLEEAVTVALNLMGYTSEDFGSSWPYGQLSMATNTGLLDGCSAQAGSAINRRDAMQIVYNMLTGNSKQGTAYIESLNYKLIEDVVLIATAEDDSSVPGGKILTSSGTYKMSDSLDTSFTGSRGDAILNSNNEIICFIPESVSDEQYTAYAVVDNDIVVSSSSGYTQSLGLDENTEVYYKGQQTTMKNASASISAGDSVRVNRASDGSVDFVVVSGGKLQGPVTVENENWIYSLGIDEGSTTVLRNGVKASVSDVNANDVVYYSSSLNTVWAYNKKITGIYESATPNKDQPAAVTVSGSSYDIESTTAFNKLSSTGKFAIGDSITLLMGKDGKIADVMAAAESKAEIVGYLTESGSKEVTNELGYKYNTYYVKIVTPDGESLEYEANKDYSGSVGSVMSVRFNNNTAYLGKAGGGGISGTVDWDNGKLGNYKLAADIRMMDVATDSSQYVITYPQRLDGVEISSSSVLYYNKNSNGEIDTLILDNVTGDAMTYGIVTQATVNNQGDDGASSSYKLDIGGSTVTLTKSNGYYSGVSANQPAMFTMSGNSVKSVKPLSQVSGTVDSVSSLELKAGKSSYKLSSSVIVYLYTGYNGYSVIPLSDVVGSNSYDLKAYYDKSEEKGGRIRIIVANEKTDD